jgi:hypothetical protein
MAEDNENYFDEMGLPTRAHPDKAAALQRIRRERRIATAVFVGCLIAAYLWPVHGWQWAIPVLLSWIAMVVVGGILKYLEQRRHEAS